MKNKIKLLMQNRISDSWPGGDNVAANGFAKSLKSFDIDVIQRNIYSFSSKEFNVVLSWNINYFWVLSHLINAKLNNKPFIIFALSTNVNDKNYQKLIVDYADGIIFLSPTERRDLSNYLGKSIPENKSFYVEVGVDNYFQSKSIGDKRGVLCVGRIERRKNQLSLIKACIKLNLPLTIVGYVADQEYFQICMKEVEDSQNIKFISYVSRSELKRLYLQNKVVANVAFFEPWGLTIREGGLANCNILMTKKTHVKAEYPQVWWCNPDSLSDIIKNLKLAYKSPNSFRFGDYICDHYSWKNQTKKLAEVIRKIVSIKPIKLKSNDWKKILETMNSQVGKLNTDLQTKNKLVNELHIENMNKQLAIEELQKTGMEKQTAIENLREYENENKTFQKSFWYKICPYFNNKNSRIEK